jgi:hypothetical protein
MTRYQLEHIIRASGAIAEVDRLVIIGSQAILGSYPDAPTELLVSMEADIFPPEMVERADLIDGSIGEDSFFHETFGYYAHGIGPDAAILPKNWEKRLVRIKNLNTNNIEGLCLSPVDLGISKLLAARKKDIAFVRTMIEKGILAIGDMEKIAHELTEDHKNRLESRLLQLSEN